MGTRSNRKKNEVIIELKREDQQGEQPREIVIAAIQKNGTFTNPPDGLCPLCKTKGQSQVLKTYRINLTQSIFLCSDPQCIYPLGYTPLDNIITSTTDLKNLSPSKQKKRNISELSTQLHPNAKRSKSDLPLNDQYSPINAATSAKAESSTSVQAVPPWEHDTTSSGISQCAWTENRESPKQNVLKTSSSFSSYHLNDNPSSALPPPGSHNNRPGSPKRSSSGQDKFHEEPLQSEDVTMIDRFCRADAVNSSMSLSETDCLEESEGKELREPEPYALPEIAMGMAQASDKKISLNGSPGLLENNTFSPYCAPTSESHVFPSPLPDNQRCSEMKDELLQEVSSTLSSGESVISVPKGSMRDMESAQPCVVLQNTSKGLCESGESCNAVSVVDSSCAETNQHTYLSTSRELESHSASSECTVLSVPQKDNKSEQILNKTSLEFVSQHHTEASATENINDDPVGALEPEFSKSLHLKQDSCGMTSTSSSPDIQPTCLSDSCSVDVCEQPCAMAFVMKAIEELTAAPLKVCHLSAPLQFSEDIEKKHMEANSSSRSEEDTQPEVAIEVDSSFGFPGISSTTDAVVDNSSVGPKEALLPEGHVSDQDDTIGCQQSRSETVTTSALLQDSLPECQSLGKCLSDVPLSPCTSSSIPIDKNGPIVASADILSPNNPIPERLDLIYGCQKNVCDKLMPSDIQMTTSVHDSCPLMGVCNTVCPVSEKDGSSTEQVITPTPDNPLLETKKLNQASVEPCGVSTSPQNIEAPFNNADNSIFDVSGSSYNLTYTMDDADCAKISSHISNSQKKHNGNTLTSCSQTKGIVDKEACPLHDSFAQDIGSGNQAATPSSDSEESKSSIMKTSFENTLLPDLLLDIQPEHRMEDKLSAVPSPTCDADLMVTISAESKQPEEGNLLEAKLDKVGVQEAENQMEITDPETSNHELQNSINLSDTLSSESTLNNESIENDSSELSVIEQNQSDEMPKARMFENTQRVLHWRNRKSLCWLDCILSALVQSRTLGAFVAKHGSDEKSIILNLFAKYDEATALCKEILKKSRAGKPTKAETCLHEVRMNIFDKLAPLLKCELGEKESPVFALPLLLKLDPDFQKLFVHSFTWNFKCESCGYTYQDRCQKTITTFTKIVPDWRPLNAVHRSPCNKCQAADQRREMDLETLQPMFMLHFVEGLPSSNLKEYAFQFGEHWYEISTVIRYRDQHFSTWMSNADDTWLESDDLKGSFCRRHQKFRMRAEDIHVVIWERSTRKNIHEESPLSNGTEQSENRTSIPTAEITLLNSSMEFLHVRPETEVGVPASTHCSPQVPLTSECIFPNSSTEHTLPLTPVVETSLVPPMVVPVSSSVSDISDPLVGMEGYADDDIITLTLVEIPFDSMGQAVDLKPPNPSVPQVAAIPDMVQPAAVEILNDSAELLQHTDPGQSTQLLSQPPRSNAAPVCTTQQNPIQPYCGRKPTRNMPAAAVATSTPISKTFTAKKSIVDNLMGTLVKNDDFFLNSNLSSRKTTTSKPWQAVTLLKESDFSGATKKADNFEGFRTKTIDNSGRSGLLLSKLLKNSSISNVPKEKSAPSVKSFLAPAALAHMKAGKNGLNNGKTLAKDGFLSGEDKVRKLRIKLLKKLKAKKYELAMLEKIAKLQQNGSRAGESDGVQPGGVNRKEHLQGFLQELQDRIDNADNESIGTASTCTSICSSPGDAEFFAELFSPSPVDNPGNDSRFLEMLADGYGISSEQSQPAPSFNYPMNNTTTQSTSGADTLPSTFNQSSSGEESLNLLSTSTMAVLNDDNGYLDSFVDIF
ncbi:SUMO-specific isopeptidase USPL1 [Mantella aurantiaca]